jgi:subtilisin family serine protease
MLFCLIIKLEAWCELTYTYCCCFAADIANVISVGSINSDGQRSSFSNYGKNTVDLFAPGGGILSTVPSNSYATYSGTSMVRLACTCSSLLQRKNATHISVLIRAVLSSTVPCVMVRHHGSLCCCCCRQHGGLALLLPPAWWACTAAAASMMGLHCCCRQHDGLALLLPPKQHASLASGSLCASTARLKQRSTFPTHILVCLLLLLLLQATPHVSGAVALYAAAHRRLKGTWPTPAQTKAAVMDTGVPDSRYTVSGCGEVFIHTWLLSRSCR